MPSWLFLLQKSVAIIWIVRFALYKKPDIGEPPADVTLEQWRHGKEVAERALTIVDLFAALMLGLGMIFSNC